MKKYYLHFLIILFVGGIHAQTPTIELCTTIDGSGSINSSDFQLQLEGLAAAIEDPGVVRQDGSVTLSIVQFSSSAQVEVPPTLIVNQASATNIASQIRNINQLDGSTAIGDAIALCAQQFTFTNGRQVIDVSTDGDSNTGQAPGTASDNAITAGVDEINALGVGSGIDVNELENLVRPQPASQITDSPNDGFVTLVDDFNQYVTAIALKLGVETNTIPPPITSPPTPPISLLQPTPVPTLSEWSMLIMIMLVLGMAILSIKRHEQEK
jgi:hypothetical protein